MTLFLIVLYGCYFHIYNIPCPKFLHGMLHDRNQNIGYNTDKNNARDKK